MVNVNWRGESRQDIFAFEACGERLTGTFLDIGCNEPIRWNNTYALEGLGWHGFGFDIEPAYAPMWKQRRRSPFVLADASKLDWRIVSKRWDVIDYLSLDIDENETGTLALTILQRLVGAGLRFRCMTVEHDAYRHGDKVRAPIREFLRSQGYRLAYADVEIRKGNGKPFEDWWIQ